jgi:hypothetical protein
MCFNNIGKLLAFLLFYSLSLHAQHQEISEKPHIWESSEATQSESSANLLNAFKKGHFNGHFRYFFMATLNEGALTDYFANAVGGGLKFETANFHGFQFGLSGFYIFNIGSSDLAAKDPLTGKGNRYEIGLFDIEDPSNKKSLDRLEEFYLKYKFKKTHVTFGRQLLNTPFFNLQDGRMRPTTVEGVWIESNELKNNKLVGGYIYGVSPRSTVSYFKLEESIGIYPSGVATDGSPSGYAGNLKSAGVLMLGLHNHIVPRLKIQAWEMLVLNIFNSMMLQADYALHLESRGDLSVGLQGIFQTAVGNGGSDEAAHVYFDEGQKTLALGAMVGWSKGDWQTSLNFNRIAGGGRYLMPREWGRDPFYTFLPRERNEGLGNANAYVLKVAYEPSKWRLKSSLGLGYYDLPDVLDFAHNKYGMPSYAQLNLDLKYKFAGALNGFSAQFLFVHKFNVGNDYGNNKYIFNKTNMDNINFLINYHF